MNFKTKIAGLALAFTLAFAGVVNVQAATTSELIDLLVSLGIISADQVAVVNAAVGGTTTGTGSSTGCLLQTAPDMTLGATGANVTNLQTFLVEGGYMTMPAGVAYGYFGGLTQSSLGKYQAAMGITPAAGYFGRITRASIKCVVETPEVIEDEDVKDTKPSTSLKGGAGDITLTQKTSGTEKVVAEGKSEAVLGMEGEADDNSDIEVTSLRLVVEPTGAGSTRLTRYADELVIELDGKEVGAIDASDFSRSGAVHTGTISLKNAIVKAGKKGRFNVVFVAKESIDSKDRIGGEVNVKIDRVRYEDATGAVLSDTKSFNADVTFEDSTESDDIKLQSSSANPKEQNLEVEKTSKSEEAQVFAFRMRAGDDSSDMSITEINISAKLNNPTGGIATTTADRIIDDIWLEVDGAKYTDWSSSNSNVDIADGSNKTALYKFTIDEEDLVIGAGDRTDVEVFVVFGKQDGNYDANTTIELSVATSSVVVENDAGDSVDVTGSTMKSEVHTLVVDGVNVKYVSSSSTKVDEAGKVQDIKLVFDVTAVGDNVDISRETSVASSTLANIKADLVDSAGTTAVFTLTSDASLRASVYTVYEGQTKRFTLTTSVSAVTTTGQYYVELTEVAGSPVSGVESDPVTIIQ